jgi:hypothetical protein
MTPRGYSYGPWTQLVDKMVEMICNDINQFFKEKIKKTRSKWNELISASSQHLGWLLEKIVRSNSLSDLKIPMT